MVESVGPVDRPANAGSPAFAYNPALDGLRGLAICLVLLFHARVPAFSAGYLGVDVFFVLSGHLITTLLLAEIDRTGTVDWRRFVLRRFLRLAPALVAMCLAVYLLSFWYWPEKTNPAVEVLLTLSYLTDLSVALWRTPQILGHSWSLSVEEHFYILWPLVLLYLCRSRGARTVPWLTALYVLSTAWRLELLQSGTSWWQVYFRVDARLSGLMLGALLACMIAVLPNGIWRRMPAWVVLVPVAGAMFFIGDWGDSRMLLFGIPLVEIATASVILACISGKGLAFRALSANPLVWLGKLSYGLYLWHHPIFRFLEDQMDWPLALAIGLPSSIACAWLSYMTVERWGLQMRARITKQG